VGGDKRESRDAPSSKTKGLPLFYQNTTISKREIIGGKPLRYEGGIIWSRKREKGRKRKQTSKHSAGGEWERGEEPLLFNRRYRKTGLERSLRK